MESHGDSYENDMDGVCVTKDTDVFKWGRPRFYVECDTEGYLYVS
jgi:hypothetical protein